MDYHFPHWQDQQRLTFNIKKAFYISKIMENGIKQISIEFNLIETVFAQKVMGSCYGSYKLGDSRS